MSSRLNILLIFTDQHRFDTIAALLYQDHPWADQTIPGYS